MLVTVRFIGSISEKVQNLMFKCVISNRILIQKIRGSQADTDIRKIVS
jgi:hypothetical protein